MCICICVYVNIKYRYTFQKLLSACSLLEIDFHLEILSLPNIRKYVL